MTQCFFYDLKNVVESKMSISLFCSVGGFHKRHSNIMRKKGVLQLALQLNFWVAKDICNSLYLYIMNANEQVAWVTKLQLTIFICRECYEQMTWVVKLQLTIYTVQFIATQLQFYQNKSFSITMQLHYNCMHDVLLMSLIVIHLLKSNTWHYEDFLTYIYISKYWSPFFIMIVNDGPKFWHVAI